MNMTTSVISVNRAGEHTASFIYRFELIKSDVLSVLQFDLISAPRNPNSESLTRFLIRSMIDNVPSDSH
jgi:hypothetical protein